MKIKLTGSSWEFGSHGRFRLSSETHPKLSSRMFTVPGSVSWVWCSQFLVRPFKNFMQREITKLAIDHALFQASGAT
ncbi:hypothetical protein HanRHA438_Chr13g0603241 [Helianthus annuus]|uniref:Uncharacterized protein n=1 Tax=Helianthus annuus TaxID=4232 RepID=A0A251STI6_HELAN|nr:hypothetical protein HanXRQr2_Chr13g0592591 [Helianthus annuus]KAJ0477238.1 hypothetical protein HanHA300_Chr13g0486121 [Helianthus annuus]KAJ0481632.1 hypothetical protein HanIR_Chr13g0644761 [Helianthus annuus]KAJ0498069.1 hypothetical protein HanHA89_Chr13g0518241 [Helianthus annuus]KAJ0664068.1 hypothetical protein HanLR1_Chr13g0488071 [Helianthus annuus]